MATQLQPWILLNPKLRHAVDKKAALSLSLALFLLWGVSQADLSNLVHPPPTFTHVARSPRPSKPRRRAGRGRRSSGSSGPPRRSCPRPRPARGPANALGFDRVKGGEAAPFFGRFCSFPGGKTKKQQTYVPSADRCPAIFLAKWTKHICPAMDDHIYIHTQFIKTGVVVGPSKSDGSPLNPGTPIDKLGLINTGPTILIDSLQNQGNIRNIFLTNGC